MPAQEVVHPTEWTADMVRALPEDGNRFERWRPDDGEPEVISDVLTWQPLQHIPALLIPLDDFFRALHG